MTLVIRSASIIGIDLIGALRCSVKGLRIAYDPNMNVFPVDPDVAACRLLAAAKRTTPCLARARCARDSSRGRCLRALRGATCVSESRLAYSYTHGCDRR